MGDLFLSAFYFSVSFNMEHFSYNDKKKYELAFRRWLIAGFKSKKFISYLKNPDRDKYRLFFEQYFNKSINWASHGKLWHIDHIVPISTFNYGEIHLCWSLENLRVLRVQPNKIKGSSLYDSLYEIDKRLKFNVNNENLIRLKVKVDSLLINEKYDDYFYKNLLP